MADACRCADQPAAKRARGSAAQAASIECISVDSFQEEGGGGGGGQAAGVSLCCSASRGMPEVTSVLSSARGVEPVFSRLMLRAAP
eukprot:8846389-Alexandrium_andersonii.AAC.1